MSKNHKQVCTTLNYNKHFLILTSTIAGCISISTFAFLLGIPIGLNICRIAAGINKQKTIIQKMKKKYDKIVLLAKSKLNSVEVLISKALFNSDILVIINLF